MKSQSQRPLLRTWPTKTACSDGLKYVLAVKQSSGESDKPSQSGSAKGQKEKRRATEKKKSRTEGISWALRKKRKIVLFLKLLAPPYS